METPKGPKGRVVFPFSWQSFTRYVRDNCDSEQETDGAQVDERWLYRNMMEYLNVKGRRDHVYLLDEFAPDEFHTGRGAPMRVDLARRNRSEPNGNVSVLLEAKLMVVDNRSWAQEIMTDILRVASVKKSTNQKTQRYVLVVGQERCWAKVKTQLDGLLPKMCHMYRTWNPIKREFWVRTKWTKLDDALRKQARSAVEDYLVPFLPAEIGIELAGCSVSKREPDEEPTVGITARLWRITPRGCPVPAPVATTPPVAVAAPPEPEAAPAAAEPRSAGS